MDGDLQRERPSDPDNAPDKGLHSDQGWELGWELGNAEQSAPCKGVGRRGRIAQADR